MCSSIKYPYSPTEGIGISWGLGDCARPKKINEMYEAYYWNFERGDGGGGGEWS